MGFRQGVAVLFGPLQQGAPTMRRFQRVKSERGQAMVEVLLSLSLLFLMTAGMIQFFFLFTAKTSFEHACGQAARRYAAGALDSPDLAGAIWDQLGPDRRYFDRATLKVVPSATGSLIGRSFLDATGPLNPYVAKIKTFFLGYSGRRWVVGVRYKAAPMGSLLFPEGVPFQTE